MKERLYYALFSPYTLFTRPLDASPIVFCMNEGPEFFRIRKLIEEGGGVLEKARKFDSTHQRIRIHDKKMVALEKETDIFNLSYIDDCVKDNCLRTNLKEYRLGKTLFVDYDPYEILIGDKTWNDIDKLDEFGEVCSPLANFDRCPKTVPTSGVKYYTHADQVDILKYIIDHEKYNQLKDIKMWRDMAASGVVKGSRSENSLKDHFRRQILPRIHVKTYPQFQERDLNRIIRGWTQKKDHYVPSVQVEVVEKTPTLRPRVNFAVPEEKEGSASSEVMDVKEEIRSPLPSPQKGSQKTRIDESMELQEEQEKDERSISPSNKRIKLSCPDDSEKGSSSFSCQLSLKASQIFSNEILEEGEVPLPRPNTRPDTPENLPNYFESFPTDLMEFLEKGSINKSEESNSNVEGNDSNKASSHSGRKSMALINKYELRQNRISPKEKEGNKENGPNALSQTHPTENRVNNSPYFTRASQSLTINTSEVLNFQPLRQSTQKDAFDDEREGTNTRIEDYLTPVGSECGEIMRRSKCLRSKRKNSKPATAKAKDTQTQPVLSDSNPTNLLISHMQSSRVKISVRNTAKDHEDQMSIQVSDRSTNNLKEYNKNLRNCLQTKLIKVSLRRLSSFELAKYGHELEPLKEDLNKEFSKSDDSSSDEEIAPSANAQSSVPSGRQKSFSAPLPPPSDKSKNNGLKMSRKSTSKTQPRKRQLYSNKDEAVPPVFTPIDKDVLTKTVVPPLRPATQSKLSTFDEVEDLLSEDGSDNNYQLPDKLDSSDSEEDLPKKKKASRFKEKPEKKKKKKEKLILDQVFPLESNDSPETSFQPKGYTEKEDKILVELLGQGHVSGADIKKLYKSKSLPGRSMRSIKDRLRELKRSLKSRKKKKDKCSFTASDDQKILEWIIKRHCFGALSGELIWKRIEDENLFHHKSAHAIHKRFMSHIIPNIDSFNLEKEIKSKFILALD